MATKVYISDSELADYTVERKWLDSLKGMKVKMDNLM